MPQSKYSTLPPQIPTPDKIQSHALVRIILQKVASAVLLKQSPIASTDSPSLNHDIALIPPHAQYCDFLIIALWQSLAPPTTQ